jgi:hypothetical protein
MKGYPMVTKQLARIVFGITGVISVSAAMVVPSSAAAHSTHSACKQWKLVGKWSSGQSNDNHVTYAFTQKKKKLHGTTHLPSSEATSAGYSHGKLSGTLTGSHVSFVVVWDRSTVDGVVHRGHYYGTVTHGKIVGHTKDLSVNGMRYSFKAQGKTRCIKH